MFDADGSEVFGDGVDDEDLEEAEAEEGIEAEVVVLASDDFACTSPSAAGDAIPSPSSAASGTATSSTASGRIALASEEGAFEGSRSSRPAKKGPFT